MSLVVIDRDKKFYQFRLLPYIPHHKAFIERTLAGMAIAESEAGQSSYRGFVKYYLSFGLPLLGIDEQPTFEHARDEEKLAAGWERNLETGVLEDPKAKLKKEVVKEEPKEEAKETQKVPASSEKKGKK